MERYKLVESINQLEEIFPNTESLRNYFHQQHVRLQPANQDGDCYYDSVRNHIANNFLRDQDNYGLPYGERNDDNRLPYSQWDVKQVIVVPHTTMRDIADAMACSCIRQRHEHEDATRLSTTSMVESHTQLHDLYNIFVGVNENIRTQVTYRHQSEYPGEYQYLCNLYDLAYSTENAWERRLLSTQRLNKTSKHKQFKNRAKEIIDYNTFHFLFLLADETGEVVNMVHSQYHPKYNPSNPTQSMGDYRWTHSSEMVNWNGYAQPSYGYYEELSYNPYEDRIDYMHGLRGRNYKDCKLCGGRYHKDYMSFMIPMVGRSRRFSACFLCVSTHSAGWKDDVQAFVQFPHNIPSEAATRRYYEWLANNSNQGHISTLIPVWSRRPSTSNSSQYQWEDVSRLNHPRLENISQSADRNGYNNDVGVTFSLEARKFFNWVVENEYLYTPEEGAGTSVGHVGSVFHQMQFVEGNVDDICAFDSIYDNSDPADVSWNYGLRLDADNIDEDVIRQQHWTDDDPPAVYYTSYVEVDHDESGRIDYGVMDGHDEEPRYIHTLLVSLFDYSQWSAYLDSRGYRGRPARARQSVLSNPQMLDRHGISNINLIKKKWDFTFPIWQVADQNGSQGRLVKPLAQPTWANAVGLSEEQIRVYQTIDRLNISDAEKMAYFHQTFGPFFGMELEIVGRRDEHSDDTNEMENTHRRLVEMFHPAWEGIDTQTQKVQLVYRVQDSSVDSGSAWGHELVTQPMSLTAFQAVPQDFWESLRRNYTAYYHENSRGGGRNRGVGIHIHLDHDAFTTGHLWAFLHYFYSTHDAVYFRGGFDWSDTVLGKIAQRGDGQWAHWNYPTHRVTSNRNLRKLHEIVEATALRRTHDRVGGNMDKYSAINWEKNGTIELRYFNSHTLQGRVLGKLEFVDAVYYMAKDYAVELGDFNSTDGSSNEMFQHHLGEYVDRNWIEYWNTKLWTYVLSTRANRYRYRNLIKWGREEDMFNLGQLELTMEENEAHEVRDFVNFVSNIEGGTQ